MRLLPSGARTASGARGLTDCTPPPHRQLERNWRSRQRPAGAIEGGRSGRQARGKRDRRAAERGESHREAGVRQARQARGQERRGCSGGVLRCLLGCAPLPATRNRTRSIAERVLLRILSDTSFAASLLSILSTSDCRMRLQDGVSGVRGGRAVIAVVG